jgi:hypothetical protein
VLPTAHCSVSVGLFAYRVSCVHGALMRKVNKIEQLHAISFVLSGNTHNAIERWDACLKIHLPAHSDADT